MTLGGDERTDPQPNEFTKFTTYWILPGNVIAASGLHLACIQCRLDQGLLRFPCDFANNFRPRASA